MFGDRYRQVIIDSRERRLSTREVTIRSEHSQLFKEVKGLRDRMDALMPSCQSRWEILRDEKGMSEEKGIKKIEEMDLRSGKKDGKMETVDCRTCDRPNNPRHHLCLYCGNNLPSLAEINPHKFNL